jgi:hypothetical protein
MAHSDRTPVTAGVNLGPQEREASEHRGDARTGRATLSDSSRRLTAMSQQVVDIPGLPPDVEVRRSTRRRRSVTAYREGGRTIVVVPARMTRAEIRPYVDELVARLLLREQRHRRTDAELMVRARELSRRHLDSRATPASVRWVSNQRKRWGSCTPLDSSIRLSDRLMAMPEHVVDYVLLHELVHLLVPGHGPDFEAWMQRYPRLLEARAFLAGVDHATGHGLEPDDASVDDEDDGLGQPPGDDRDAGAEREPTREPADVVRPPRRARPRDPGPGAEPLF